MRASMMMCRPTRWCPRSLGRCSGLAMALHFRCFGREAALECMHVHRREVRAPALDTGTQVRRVCGPATRHWSRCVHGDVQRRSGRPRPPIQHRITGPGSGDVAGPARSSWRVRLQRGPRISAAFQSLESVASVGSTNWFGTLTLGDGRVVGVPCAVVSGTFFDVLHARPFLGRTFRPADDWPSAPRGPVLSHALWAEHFGADPGVVGRTVLVQEEGPQQPFEIIGVMRRNTLYPRGAEYWTPAAPRLAAIARHRHEPLATWFENVGIFYGIGRMRGGVTEATTRAELVVLLDAISHELKIDLAGLGVTTAVTPLLEHIFGPARRALLVLTGAVSLVLLMACMNVAGLLFARGASRSREMAVRAALGASRGALVRQLLAESGLIACCGTVTGILIAAIVLQSIVALSPADIPETRFDRPRFPCATAGGNHHGRDDVAGRTCAGRTSQPHVSGQRPEGSCHRCGCSGQRGTGEPCACCIPGGSYAGPLGRSRALRPELRSGCAARPRLRSGARVDVRREGRGRDALSPALSESGRRRWSPVAD